MSTTNPLRFNTLNLTQQVVVIAFVLQILALLLGALSASSVGVVTGALMLTATAHEWLVENRAFFDLVAFTLFGLTVATLLTSLALLFEVNGYFLYLAIGAGYTILALHGIVFWVFSQNPTNTSQLQ